MILEEFQLFFEIFISKGGFPLGELFARSEFFFSNFLRKWNEQNRRQNVNITFCNEFVKKKSFALNKKDYDYKVAFITWNKKGEEERFWVRQIYTERKEKGEYHLLVRQMMLHDKEYFFQCFRMSPTRFEELKVSSTHYNKGNNSTS